MLLIKLFCKTIMKHLTRILTTFLAAASLTHAQDTWTSIDGKTIKADFVRISDGNIKLKMNGKAYSFRLKKLNKKSQAYAHYLQANLKQWAADNLKSPIISESLLQEILSFDSKIAEGKNFLVEGHIESIRGTSTLSKRTDSKVDLKLQGGTTLIADFVDVADGKKTKIKVEDNAVILLKYRKLDGGSSNPYQNHTPEKTLLSVGQSVTIRARVKAGRIIGTSFATSREVTDAQMMLAKQNGELTFNEAAALNRAKIRIEYLEAALKGNAGTASVSGNQGHIGTVTYEFSKAEKEAMRKELELLRAQLKAASSP